MYRAGQVVERRRLAGAGPEPGFIGRWERLYHDGGLAALAPRPRERPRNMHESLPPQSAREEPTPDERPCEELLKEIEYLRAEVPAYRRLLA